MVLRESEDARPALALTRAVSSPSMLPPAVAGRAATRWERHLVLAVLAVDTLAMLAAVGLADLIRLHSQRTPTSIWRDLLLTASIFAAWLGALFLNRAYESRFLGLGAEEFKRVFGAGTALLAAVATVSYAVMADTGRTLVVVALPVATALALIGRYGVRLLVVRARTRGKCMHRVLVVGTPEGVAEFVAATRRAAHAGLQVV